MSQGSSPCTPAEIGPPVLIFANGIAVMVCDRGFPEACDACDLRFDCFTRAQKRITLKQWRGIWVDRWLDGYYGGQNAWQKTSNCKQDSTKNVEDIQK